MEHVYNGKENTKYLKLLKQNYSSSQAVIREIVNLTAITNLPKGTEFFLSDIHGEYEAFLHIKMCIRDRKKTSGVLTVLLMLPLWVSGLVILYSFVVMLNNSGIINTVLMSLGIIKKPIDLLYNNFAVIVGMKMCIRDRNGTAQTEITARWEFRAPI